jgi:hypothetical protein
MYGLKAGTRLYEAGIPSNRASLRHGEIKSHGGTNRSSRAKRFKALKKWSYKFIKVFLFFFLYFKY